MTAHTLTIATRESPLALWQAERIRALIGRARSDLKVQLLGMTTRGDQILGSPLAEVGGKGLFVKELEYALLDRRADIAVHSAKDMPMQLPEGLALDIVDQRAEPRDALVLPAHQHPGRSTIALDLLAEGAVVGTSSLRRKCQLLRCRPDLRCDDLRGNVNTRLAKLDSGQYAGIVLAGAGLSRLDLAHRISAFISLEDLLPAVGQGALAVEYRSGDTQISSLLEKLVDPVTAICVTAERSMSAELDGGCQVPLAGYAEFDGELLTLTGRVGSADGSELIELSKQQVIEHSDKQAREVAASLGESVAAELLARGAGRLLQNVSES